MRRPRKTAASQSLEADFSPSSGAEEEARTGSDFCTSGCKFCLAPPGIGRWWWSAPWWAEGLCHSSNTTQCTGEDERQRQAKRGGDIKVILVYRYSHQSAHPQIFPSVLIALVNSWMLFICCRLMQSKSHYVWMDAVPLCRAARQIWVTPAGSWSFKINRRDSCHQHLDSPSLLNWQTSHRFFRTTCTGSAETNNTMEKEKKKKCSLWVFTIWNILGTLKCISYISENLPE